MSLPLRHRSEFRILGPLAGVQGLPLEDETPLIAADRDFARAHGGPITRAFIAALPGDPSLPVVIDSSLVWLAPGLAHGFELGPGSRLARPRGPLCFMHESFPGAATGVRNASNRNREAVHRLCILGLDCTPEVAVGEIACASDSEAEAFWLPTESFEARERLIERRLVEGTLTCTRIPLGTMVEFGWGALMRGRPATRTGFQLLLRATMGDPRPLMNARRNLSIV
jgi:hypothetical protein